MRQWNFPVEYSIEIMISLHYRNKEMEIMNVSLENRMDGRTDGLRRCQCFSALENSVQTQSLQAVFQLLYV